MSAVRAKFRCLSMTYTHKGTVEVELKPVIAKNKDWKDGSEENAHFWNASPSGSCELRFNAFDVADNAFEVGEYYYIDMSPWLNEEYNWKLWTITEGETSLSVHLGRLYDTKREDGMVSADLKLDIHNETAWVPFKEAKAGSVWSITFSKAGGTHKSCPYTG